MIAKLAVALTLTGGGLALAQACRPPAPKGVPPLQVERALALPGLTGRIDHMAFDPKRGVLFVAGVGGGVLSAVEVASGRSLGRVEHLDEPQGVAYLPALDQVAVATGGDGAVRFYAAADLRPIGRVQVAGDADNLRLDDRSGRLVVADGKGFAVIDPVKRAVISRTDIGGHPEGFQLDPATGRVIANVPGQRRILSVDLASGKPAASWPQRSLMNFPMALSSDGKLAAAIFRLPSQMLVFEPTTGMTRQRIQSCGDSDDAFFDPKRGRLYVVCGAGVVQTFDTGQEIICAPSGVQPKNRGKAFVVLGETKTRSGGRTGLFIPSLDRLLVAARDGAGGPAQILVLKPAA